MRTAQTIAAQGERNTDGKSEKSPSGKRRPHPNSLANLVAPWKPGECPNPGGRPKKDKAAEIARKVLESNEEQVYKALSAKLFQGDAYAFSVLADRGYGKLKQTQVHTGDEDGGPINANLTVTFVKPESKE